MFVRMPILSHKWRSEHDRRVTTVRRGVGGTTQDSTGPGTFVRRMLDEPETGRATALNRMHTRRGRLANWAGAPTASARIRPPHPRGQHLAPRLMRTAGGSTAPCPAASGPQRLFRNAHCGWRTAEPDHRQLASEQAPVYRHRFILTRTVSRPIGCSAERAGAARRPSRLLGRQQPVPTQRGSGVPVGRPARCRQCSRHWGARVRGCPRAPARRTHRSAPARQIYMGSRRATTRSGHLMGLFHCNMSRQ